MTNQTPLFIRFKELKQLFFGGNIGRSTIDRWEQERDFPKRIKVGANSVVWNSQQVQEWIEQKSNAKKEIRCA